MKIVFVEKANGPERLVCDAEIHFGEPGLEGMRLVGFSVWRGSYLDKPEDFYVTFPSRAFGTATERRFLDYIRSVEVGDPVPGRKLKDLILEEYRRQTMGPVERAATEPGTAPGVMTNQTVRELVQEERKQATVPGQGPEPLAPPKLAPIPEPGTNTRFKGVEPDDNGGF